MCNMYLNPEMQCAKALNYYDILCTYNTYYYHYTSIYVHTIITTRETTDITTVINDLTTSSIRLLLKLIISKFNYLLMYLKQHVN